MKKLLSIAAATLLVGGLVSVPVYAQTSSAQPAAPAQQSAPAKMPVAKHHAAKHMTVKHMAAAHMHHAARHKMSCYDHAWQSQAMKDCLAKGDMKPAAKKSMKKMPMKAKKPMGPNSAS